MSSNGTSTPTTASGLTKAGIEHNHATTNGHATNGNASTIHELDASRLTTTYTTTPRSVPLPNSAEVREQKTCSDHMVTARWTAQSGWEAPELKPYGPLPLMPTCSVLHYATECFEGLKLYRGFDGKLRLFRVSRNCERMKRSAVRVALPDFPAKELEKLILALCRVDGDKWLPDNEHGRGSFLYIRPSLIGTDAAIGVQRPKEALLFIILVCMPDMTKSLAAPAPPALDGASSESKKPASSGLRLLASNEDTIRAWPGGFGYAKLGANYGPSLVAQGEARARGFDQVLWLFGQDCRVTEAGASNFFVVWKNKETGRLELITAPLHDRIILEGVTRASILQLARERFTQAVGDAAPLDVVERSFTMDELTQAQEEGRLVEAFAAGTAFFVAPVGMIHFRGKDYEVPMDGSDSGVYARQIKQWLVNIMYGKEQHEWGVLVHEEK